MNHDTLTVSSVLDHTDFTRIEFAGVDSVATTASGCELKEGDRVNVASPIKPVIIRLTSGVCVKCPIACTVGGAHIKK